MLTPAVSLVLHSMYLVITDVVIKMHSDLQQSHDVTKLRSYASESFLTSTHAEKQEMQALNSRLAIYIDMIASLEDRNRRLIAEVSDLRIKSGSGVSSYSVCVVVLLIVVLFVIQTSYSSLSEAKKIDIAAREKVEVAVKIARLTEYLRIYGLRYLHFSITVISILCAVSTISKKRACLSYNTNKH
jgi:hypothetical protein